MARKAALRKDSLNVLHIILTDIPTSHDHSDAKAKDILGKTALSYL
jgi:hypothetical protein